MRWLRWPILVVAASLCLNLHAVHADVSQLVRSGNGFVYDIPKLTELELEVSNEFPTGAEFPQDTIPQAPSDAQLGVAEAFQDHALPHSSKAHGYDYQVPSKRFKS